MAESGEAAQDHQGSRRATVSFPPRPPPSLPIDPSCLDLSSFTHTPFYCEENVYFLCKKLCMLGVAEPNGIDLFVILISNEEKKVPFFSQKASKRSDGLVVWDYHVICIQLKSQRHRESNACHLVWDMDSSLPFPCSLNQYSFEALRPVSQFIFRYNRLFRIVHAPIFLHYFASDRSHMKDPLGNWISLPPSYEPIVAEDGTVNNLDEYISICDKDIVTNMEDLIGNVFSNRLGVVLSEEMLGEFFSLVRG